MTIETNAHLKKWAEFPLYYRAVEQETWGKKIRKCKHQEITMGSCHIIYPSTQISEGQQYQLLITVHPSTYNRAERERIS